MRAALATLLVAFAGLCGAVDRQLQLAPMQAAPGGEKRLALVIGNSSYANSPLRNPVNDARAIAKSLATTGFKVTVLEDGTQEAMFRAIRQFGDELTAGGVGLFYYAGHGMQVRGRNFLIPVNADIQREDEIEFRAVDASFVVAKMDTAKNGLNVLILDACRNNPFARSFRSGGQGLAQMDAPSGTLVAFATAPGSVAADGDGQNGLYTKHLLANLAKPGLPIEQLFKDVRNGVAKETGERQIPWESSSLRGNFFFVPPDPSQSPEAQKVAMQRAIAEAVKREQDRLSAERAADQKKMEETIRQLLAKQRADLEEEMKRRGETLAEAAPKPAPPAPPPVVPAPTVPAPASAPPPAASAPVPAALAPALPPIAVEPAAPPVAPQLASLAPTPTLAQRRPNLPQVGDRWEYAYTQTSPERRTRMAVSVQGVTGEGILESRIAGSPKDANAVARAHSAPPLLTYDGIWEFSPYALGFGDLSSGERWAAIPARNYQPCNGGLATCRYDGRVAGTEKVTTPAGTFDAIKVVVDMNARGLWGTGTAMNINTWREMIFWYAPAAKRFVKSTVRTRSGPTMDPDYELVLVSYKLN